MTKEFLLLTILTASTAQVAMAGGYLPDVPFKAPSGISTQYFGPNAFPVPKKVRCTEKNPSAELYGSYFSGFLTSEKDHTANVDFSLRLPLFTDRATFSLWGQYESYWDNPMVREARNVNPAEPLHGSKMGDICFSVDMKVLEESSSRPGVILRAACKTASGEDFPRARYYDSPGYFFDACASKHFHAKNFPRIGNSGPGLEIGIYASSGFLCWQVDQARQNDAVMYGAGIGLRHDYIGVRCDLDGYAGWKKEHDRPMVVTLRMEALPGRTFSPFLEWRHGLNDWPFNQFSAGLRYSLAR